MLGCGNRGPVVRAHGNTKQSWKVAWLFKILLANGPQLILTISEAQLGTRPLWPGWLRRLVRQKQLRSVSPCEKDFIKRLSFPEIGGLIVWLGG